MAGHRRARRREPAALKHIRASEAKYAERAKAASGPLELLPAEIDRFRSTLALAWNRPRLREQARTVANASIKTLQRANALLCEAVKGSIDER